MLLRIACIWLALKLCFTFKNKKTTQLLEPNHLNFEIVSFTLVINTWIFLIDQCKKSNKTFFTYSGEVVMMKNCCNGFQEKKTSMFIGKEIYLAIVVIFYFVKPRIVFFIDVSVLSR